jgi:hypothetical protein
MTTIIYDMIVSNATREMSTISADDGQMSQVLKHDARKVVRLRHKEATSQQE